MKARKTSNAPELLDKIKDIMEQRHILAYMLAICAYANRRPAVEQLGAKWLSGGKVRARHDHGTPVVLIWAIDPIFFGKP